MKKRLLYLFMLISSVSLFMSCSDDDDVKYPVDSELAGAYKGTRMYIMWEYLLLLFLIWFRRFISQRLRILL